MLSSFSFDYVTLEEEGTMILQTSQDSSLGIATRHMLDGPRIESQWGQDFPHVPTGPGAHPASYTMGTGSFPGIKQSGRGVDHPPPSSAEVQERV